LPGISQRVDFVVDHPDCGKILLEVKDIVNEPPAAGGFGFFDPYRPIRAHIEAGKKKFKNTADYTCALVLAAPPASFVMLEDPRTIMGAMYGDLGFQMPVNTATGVADPDGPVLNPPQQAIVLCVDENSQIQALDRTQPGLPLKKGRCGTMTKDYKRNGTTTLFAALKVLSGRVIGQSSERHRHQEFLRFLRRLEREFPERFRSI
jgi:hypothetical protein